MSSGVSNSQIKEVIGFKYPDKLLDSYTISKDLFSSKVDSNVSSILEEIKHAGKMI